MSLIPDGYLALDIKEETFITLTRKPSTKRLLVRARQWVENMQIYLEEILILTEEFSDDLGSYLHWRKMTVSSL
jgi:hypothetical protein